MGVSSRISCGLRFKHCGDRNCYGVAAGGALPLTAALRLTLPSMLEQHSLRVLAGLATQDSAIADEALAERQDLNQIKRAIHLRHLQSLSSGVPKNLAASAIRLERVSAMSRISSHTGNIARAVQGDL